MEAVQVLLLDFVLFWVVHSRLLHSLPVGGPIHRAPRGPLLELRPEKGEVVNPRSLCAPVPSLLASRHRW